eukprot:Partr_v1_DN26075_c0_g1_i1_m396 putative transcription factor
MIEPEIEISLNPSHQIPAFLTKVYNMVSDSGSNDLVRWSENGQSFLVCRQEDFAHSVLPRFFKHNNFSSFVRQLNMYGFHKVQHVLSGSLTTPAGIADTLEFTNPNFQRNRPDLLHLVKRKSSNNPNTKASPSNDDTSKALSTIQQQTGTNKPVKDLTQIIHELNAIKQTQASVAQEFQQIRAQNQLLWQESLEARQRHEQQQEVIQKILGFLVSVVSSEKLKKLSGSNSSGSPAGLTRGGDLPVGVSRKVSPGQRRLLLDRGSDEEPIDSLIPLDSSISADPQELQQKIVELMASPLQTAGVSRLSEDDALAVQPHKKLKPSSDFAPMAFPLSYPEISAPSPVPQITNGDDLTEKIDYMQDNIDDITRYLGLNDTDLQTVDDSDVNNFLENYLALSDLEGDTANALHSSTENLDSLLQDSTLANSSARYSTRSATSTQSTKPSSDNQ